MSFLRTDFKAGDPVGKVANAQNLVRIARILEGLTVVGGHLERCYSAEGGGWTLVIDGSNDGGTMADSIAVTSDRKFAVDSFSKGRLGKNNFTGSDSVGFDSNCIHVRHDICADSAFSGKPYNQLRLYLRTHGVSQSPTYMLGLDSLGQLVKVAVTDTCTVV